MVRFVSAGTFVGLLTVAVLVAGCLGGSGKPPITPDVPVDVWAAFGPAINISTDRGHRETSLAIHPQDGKVMFACAPSGVPNLAGGQSYFFRSLDEGASWQYVDVETSPTDPRQAAFEGGDCDVAFDAAGTIYTVDSWLGSLSVGASRDQGATWSGTSVAGSAPVADRPWLVGGPAGTMHMTYQDLQFGMPSAIWYTRTTDTATTFIPAVPVVSGGPDGGFTWTGNLVVAGEGKDLYSIYTRRQGATVTTGLEQSGPERVEIAISHDGGLTWTSRLISPRPGPASFLYPSLARDAAGMLHAVWAERRTDDHPTMYSHSSDDGVTWSAPQAILAGVSAYAPWVDARDAGSAVVQWFGSPTPMDADTKPSDWYTYWARIDAAGTAAMTVTTGTTTERPLLTAEDVEKAGNGIPTPEFNQVRLDAGGNMRFGMSVPFLDDTESLAWRLVYQVETRG